MWDVDRIPETPPKRPSGIFFEGRSEENPPADSHYCSVSLELGMREKVLQMETYPKFVTKNPWHLGPFERDDSRDSSLFDVALRRVCCTKWARWDSRVWSLRFLQLFLSFGNRTAPLKIQKTQKVGWLSPNEMGLISTNFQGVSYIVISQTYCY